MDIRIKEVQETSSGSWEIRIERSNGEEIVGPVYAQNMHCLLAALDLEKPEDLVGISSKDFDLKLSIANTFSKLLVSFSVEGFYGGEKPNRSKRVNLMGAVHYTSDSVALTLQPSKGNITTYYYYVKGYALQKLEKVFRVPSALLLIRKREAKFKVTADNLIATYTVSLPTPSALN